MTDIALALRAYANVALKPAAALASDRHQDQSRLTRPKSTASGDEGSFSEILAASERAAATPALLQSR